MGRGVHAGAPRSAGARRLASAWPGGHRQQGAGLIEVLIAIVMLTVGMLSLLMSQGRAVQFERSAALRGVAQQMAAGFADRMRANAQAASCYAQAQPTDPACAAAAAASPARDCLRVDCSPAEVAAFDLAELRRVMSQKLPAGDFFVERHGDGRYTIWSVWETPRLLEASGTTTAGGTDPNEVYEQDVSFSSQCPTGFDARGRRMQCLPLGVML